MDYHLCEPTLTTFGSESVPEALSRPFLPLQVVETALGRSQESILVRLDSLRSPYLTLFYQPATSDS